MERINPHYKITKPAFYLNKPMDCEYYAGGSCLQQKNAPICNEDECGVYTSSELPQIITLCGSTRFKEYFLAAAHDLTLQGWIVLMPGVFGHSDIEPSDKEKENLDKLHREKIRLSNAIFVLNIGRYIGESTEKEIEYAKSLNIPVYMYE